MFLSRVQQWKRKETALSQQVRIFFDLPIYECKQLTRIFVSVDGSLETVVCA